METETYLMFSIRLKYSGQEQLQSALDLVTELSKMITTLRPKLLET